MYQREGSACTVVDKYVGTSTFVNGTPRKLMEQVGLFETVVSTSEDTRKLIDHLGKIIRWACVVVTVLYFVLPFWFSYCPWIRRKIIFLESINFDFYVDMKAPEKYGLPCAKHFVIETEYGAKLGAWHVPPKSQREQGQNSANHSTSKDLDFSFDRPVILYFHGTAFNRAAYFRRQFYRMVTNNLDAHIVTFDYRGFGDSTNESPTISRVVEDSDAVYRWLLKKVHPQSRLIIWGHSLGSGIAIQLAHKYAGTELSVPAVILESTFTNMEDAVNSFPFSALHRFWPCYENLIPKVAGFHPDTFISNDDKMAVAVASPILILHSEDDMFLKVDLARKLYRLGHQAVDESMVKFRKGVSSPKLFRPRYVEFEAHLGYGHQASTDPRIPEKFADFLDDIRRQNNATLS